MMQSGTYRIGPADRERLLHVLGWQSSAVAPQIGAFAAIVILILFAGRVTGQDSGAVALSGAIGLIGIGALWVRSQSRRALDQWIARHSECPALLSWDDSGVHTGGCSHGEDASVSWGSIRDVIESADFIIPRTRCGPLFVRRQALNAEALADLHRRLDRHRIPRKAARDD